jgi:hypothetical protein
MTRESKYTLEEKRSDAVSVKRGQLPTLSRFSRTSAVSWTLSTSALSGLSGRVEGTRDMVVSMSAAQAILCIPEACPTQAQARGRSTSTQRMTGPYESSQQLRGRLNSTPASPALTGSNEARAARAAAI